MVTAVLHCSYHLFVELLLAICCFKFAPELVYYTLQLPGSATNLGPFRVSLPTLSLLGTA